MDDIKEEPAPIQHTQRRDSDGRRWCDTSLHSCPLVLREWLDYDEVTCDVGNKHVKREAEVFASWCCENHDQDICFKCIPVDFNLPSNVPPVAIAPSEKKPNSPTKLQGLRQVRGE